MPVTTLVSQKLKKGYLERLREMVDKALTELSPHFEAMYCHLEKDPSNVMVLGALSCPESAVEHLNRKIKYLRHKHSYQTELKWTKLIAKQSDFYRELLDLVLDTDELIFKATVVVNKNYLDHSEFNQGSHANFYYKMFFYTLRDFINPGGSYKIYLDYMDTHGRDKAAKLMEVLHNSNFGSVKAEAYIN